jgi:hypothetical protein
MNVNQVKAGINTKDPYEIAKALTLPLLTAQQNIHPNPNPKKRSYSERLTIDGTDWSPVLNSFLEARDHVFSVSAKFQRTKNALFCSTFSSVLTFTTK